MSLSTTFILALQQERDQTAAALAALRARREELDGEIATETEKLAKIDALLGLRDRPPGVAAQANGWARLSRADAVVKLLRESPYAMTPKGIVEGLGSHGRSGDQRNYISAALNYLRKKGIVRSLGDGRWELVKGGMG